MPSTLTETDFDRDEFARWYANRHLEIDSGVVLILFLPTNAPSREIRFLEVNRLIAEMTPAAIDFGVAIDGVDFHTLYVFDVTPTQWDAIQKGAPELSGYKAFGIKTLRIVGVSLR